MKTYIQLHDGVGFAIIRTEGELDHSVTPEHVTAVEVLSNEAEQCLKKKYNEETKTWTDAPVIRWCEIDDFGRIISIQRTVFTEEVKGPLFEKNIQPDWLYVDSQWVEPSRPEVIDYKETWAIEAPVETSEEKAARHARVIANGGTPNDL